ncbi:hypothetical protein MTBLM1_90167 [Rhodospirillaceae bacterium LM-1]|nr:hypothetical protein MTBLM1_90167 [Rhodospirillaceae bacterium LM-1]
MPQPAIALSIWLVFRIYSRVVLWFRASPSEPLSLYETCADGEPLWSGGCITHVSGTTEHEAALAHVGKHHKGRDGSRWGRQRLRYHDLRRGAAITPHHAAIEDISGSWQDPQGRQGAALLVMVRWLAKAHAHFTFTLATDNLACLQEPV